MDTRQLIRRIERLPTHKRVEVEDFVDFLASQTQQPSIPPTGEVDGLRQLLSHPLGIKGFEAPSRDDIYRRDEL